MPLRFDAPVPRPPARLPAATTGATAGALGGLLAGGLVSLVYLGTERVTGEPSELVKLGRATAVALGSPYRHQDSLPAPDELLRFHALHLALSSVMGAGYVAARALPPFRGAGGGALYGAGYYALFWGLVGPRLGLLPTPRRDGAPRALFRLGLLGGFGLVAALVANALSPPDPPAAE